MAYKNGQGEFIPHVPLPRKYAVRVQSYEFINRLIIYYLNNNIIVFVCNVKIL